MPSLLMLCSSVLVISCMFFFLLPRLRTYPPPDFYADPGNFESITTSADVSSPREPCSDGHIHNRYRLFESPPGVARLTS
jgi:hypothetical protein